MRSAQIQRKTNETDIVLAIDLDSDGSTIDCPVGFMSHMLELFSRHGGFFMDISCDGDTYVDDHHSTEDIGIALGAAFAEAMGDKRGIKRYGSIILPMDEALILASVDISGRGALYFDAPIPTEKVGTFDTELVKEFFEAFARNSGITLHIRKIAGDNSHHIIEGIFKAVARALREALSEDERFGGVIPSTKGML